MHIEDNLAKVTNILNQNGLILFPADGVYGVMCDATSIRAIEKAKSVFDSTNKNGHELLFSNVKMLKKYLKDLHPRIETLLALHERPLKVLVRKASIQSIADFEDRNETVIRIVKDPQAINLIERFRKPLYSLSFMDTKGVFPVPFSQIQIKNHKCLGHVELDINLENKRLEPILSARFDHEGLLTVFQYE